MTELDILSNETGVMTLQNQNDMPVLKEIPRADEDDLKEYQKQLRQFFLYGKKTSESLNVNVKPIFLTQFTREDNDDLGSLSTQFSFKILNERLKNRKELNLGFLNILKKCISGLGEIIFLHEGEADGSQAHFDFADELLSFDKVDQIAIRSVSSSLPKARLERLHHCKTKLLQAYQSYSKNWATIYVSQNLYEEFELKKNLNEAKIETGPDNPFGSARNCFKELIGEFVETISAIRVTELEVTNQYDEDLHGPYFDDFDLTYLSDEDIQYFHSILVVEEGKKLMIDPSEFMKMISDDSLIKVLAINRLEEMTSLKEEDRKENHLELVAQAMIRRNSFVFQGIADGSTELDEAFENGMSAPCPVIWNVLFMKPAKDYLDTDLIALKTAVDSRYFPKLNYDFRRGTNFASHFDIDDNRQPNQSFPAIELEIAIASGEQALKIDLTMADFLSLDQDHLKELEVIPGKYWSDNLIPLSDYLELPEESLTSKFPFIWIVDDQNVIRKAIIPVSWLKLCRARLDYWHFLQELAGIKNDLINQSIADAKSDWEALKDAEIEDIEAQLKAEFDRSRTDDLGKAIRRMLSALVDPNMVIPLTGNKSSAPLLAPLEEVEAETEIEQTNLEESREETIKPEVWVESDECTSCNDCIDLLPSVFKYNSDKQAVVYDPKGGPYAKIVAAAEKCPARCIHPGLPHDQNEKGLDKLLKRAEKYN